MNPWLTLVGGLATIILLPAVHGVINRVANVALGFVRTVVIACAGTVVVITIAAAAAACEGTGSAIEAAAWQAALGVSLAACYAVTVVGLRETSPSVRILQFLRDAGPAGRSIPEIIHHMSDPSTVTDRILSAAALGIVYRNGDRISLTRTGLVVARSLQRVKQVFHV